MPPLQEQKPIVWAVAIGILMLCAAMAYAIGSKCRPVSLEIYSAIKSTLGSCTAAELTPAPDLERAAELGVQSEALDAPPGVNPTPRETPINDDEAIPFGDLLIGETYVLSDQLHPDAFNAPLYDDRPSNWGNRSSVVGTLSAGTPFVIDKTYTTRFFGYAWIALTPVNADEDTPTLWMPWGEKETPVLPVTP